MRAGAGGTQQSQRSTDKGAAQTEQQEGPTLSDILQAITSSREALKTRKSFQNRSTTKTRTMWDSPHKHQTGKTKKINSIKVLRSLRET